MSDQNPDLEAAIERAAAFRASWNADDEICECSRLTPGDLDLLIAAARRDQGMVSIRHIDFREPLPADLSRAPGK
jgi:hypothetical protein